MDKELPGRYLITKLMYETIDENQIITLSNNDSVKASIWPPFSTWTKNWPVASREAPRTHDFAMRVNFMRSHSTPLRSLAIMKKKPLTL